MSVEGSNGYRGLLMSEEAKLLLETDYNRFKHYCNGVGSKVGGWWDNLVYHLTPNTIWFLNITCCSDIHDVEYSIPKHFKSEDDALIWFDEANLRFYDNLTIHIQRQNSWRWVKKLRMSRAGKYYWLLGEYGWESFIAGKEIGVNDEGINSRV